VAAPTLPQVLGVPDPSNPSAPVADAPKLTAKLLSRAMLATPQYRESLLRRILMDELPPAVECKLWDYAYGKPVERVEVLDTTTPLTKLSAQALEERAAALVTLARQLRQTAAASSETETEESGTSIH